MSKAVTLLLLILLTSIVGIKTSPTSVSSKTIVVPRDFQTIQKAVNNATEGDTVFVRKGTYNEPSLVINKSLSLVGECANGTVIRNSDNPWITWNGMWPPPSISVIQIDANNVTLFGFTLPIASIEDSGIVGRGNGTRIVGNVMTGNGRAVGLAGSYCTVAENSIYSNAGISITGSFNNISANRFEDEYLDQYLGISVQGSNNNISGNTLNNSRRGIEVSGNSNFISRNEISATGEGIVLSGGQYNIVFGNKITNTYHAALNFRSAHNNIVVGNYLKDNNVCIQLFNLLETSENNTFYFNNIYYSGVRRETEFLFSPGRNYWDNDKAGNYWFDGGAVLVWNETSHRMERYHNETDDNGDGICDFPFIINENNIDRYPLMAPIEVKEYPPLEIDNKSQPLLLLTVVAVLGTSTILATVGSLVYYKKRKREKPIENTCSSK